MTRKQPPIQEPNDKREKLKPQRREGRREDEGNETSASSTPLRFDRALPDKNGAGGAYKRKGRQAKRQKETLLEQVAWSARQCQELEREFGQNPPPELETLIKLHRVLLFRLSTGADEATTLLHDLADIMKPLLAWARLEEKQRDRALVEQKYRDEVAARKAAIERELAAGKSSGGINPETLERVERELRLL